MRRGRPARPARHRRGPARPADRTVPDRGRQASLVTPTSGTATFGGHRYADLPHPSATVGAVLD
ncbi:hypothetical protein ACWDTT_38000, partial [Streptosporangium sandarakinum]